MTAKELDASRKEEPQMLFIIRAKANQLLRFVAMSERFETFSFQQRSCEFDLSCVYSVLMTQQCHGISLL